MASRRGLLQIAGGAVLTALGLAIAAPAALFVTFPTRRRTVSGGEEPIDVGPLERLPEGVPVRVPVTAARRRDAWTAERDVQLGAAWLVRSGGSVAAWSTVCPHTGCAVDWDAAGRRFACPCHNSVFAPDGRYVSGPAPRGMDPLDCGVKEGRVSLAYRRFRPGVPSREPV
jgi:Rieske Fe-S protein